jgi:myo-inositol-1(or 4)-monophosphatase
MTEHDEDALLAVATTAARAAADELLPRFGHRQEGVRTKSGPTDLVSDADVAAETAIRRVLSEQRPGDAVLGEEGGESGGEHTGSERDAHGSSVGGEGLRWVVDPLDGTINFLFGIPAFAVSVACEDAEGTVAGVVLDPIRDECFAATRGGEPTLNGERIEASGRSELATALVATGFSYDAAVRARQAEVVTRVLPRVRDIRRVGAAALDLVWCACGRFDAYYERGVHRWDFLAGALVASRAGLEVRELEEAGENPFGVLAAPAALVDDLTSLVLG